MAAQFGLIARCQQDWLAAVDFAADYGFDHVELRLDRMLPDDLVAQPGFLETVAGRAVYKAITLSLHGMNDVDCNAKVAQVRDAIREVLCEQRRMAQKLDARWLVIHTGRGHCANTPERKASKITRCAAMLAEVLDATAQCSVPLALENLPRMPTDYGRCYFGDCLEELDTIAAQVGSEDLRYVWDFGHAKVGAGPGEYKSELRLALAHPRLIGLHMHTNDGSGDQHKHFDANTMAPDRNCLAALVQRAAKGIPMVFETEWVGAAGSREQFLKLQEQSEREATRCA